MAENQKSIINRGIEFSKKIISCVFLLKNVDLNEKTEFRRYIYHHDTFLFTVGVVLSSFYQRMPSIISRYGYMIFFPILLSGMISLITSVCYAELVYLHPTSGGAYRYVYYTMGEVMAFLVGWSSIYSSLLGVVDRTEKITQTIDVSVFGGQVANFTVKNLPLGGWNNYFIRILPNAKLENIFILLALSGTSILGAACGKIMLYGIAVFNILIIFSCLTIFWFYMDMSEFSIIEATTDFSFFTEGAVKGHLFYMDFEVTMFSGAEAFNPRVSIPSGLVEGVLVGFVIYMISVVLYSARQGATDEDSSISAMEIALENLGFKQFCMLAPIGHVLCQFLSGIAQIYEGSRVMYSMAKDGLIFSVFGYLNPQLNNPLKIHVFIAVICYVVSVFIGIAPSTQWTIVALETIIRIMALLAYLLSRYGCESNDLSQEEKAHKMRWVLTNCPHRLNSPTKTTETISMLLIFLSVVAFVLAELIMMFYIIRCNNKQAFIRICFFISLLTGFISILLLNQQPVNDRRNFLYELRGVPHTPILAILWYTLILMFLPPVIWVKIFCWIMIGLVFYFSYACMRSKEYTKQKTSGAGESSSGVSMHNS